jgi:hypothetical protein
MAALEAIKRTKEEANKGNDGLEDDYLWGSAQVLADVVIGHLSRHHLKNHLEARDLSIEGTKHELVVRLESSIEEERLAGQAYTEALEAEFLMNVDLEERGSVYAIGSNQFGQLGLGDTTHRNTFTVVPQSRGIGVRHVATVSCSFRVLLMWGKTHATSVCSPV